MGKLTLAEIRDYLRSITGEMSSDRINNSTLNADINLAQRKIQMNTIDLGIKQFTKIKYGSGNIAATPEDMIFHPQAIIDIEASAGVKAAGTVSFDFGIDLTITFKEPGTVGNLWTISFVATSGALAVSSFNATTKTVTISTPATVLSSMRTLFRTNSLLNTYFTLSSPTTAEDEDAPLELDRNPTVIQLTGGTGNGWKTATEKTIERFNRAKNNTFQAGSSLEPIYRRLGDSEAAQTLEFSPSSIQYWKAYYHYLLPDLEFDTDVSGLPAELEDLLLVEGQRRIYIYLKEQAENEQQKAEYQRTISALDEKYVKNLMNATSEKIRTESADLT